MKYFGANRRQHPSEELPMPGPIVFFSRCRPQDSDPIEIVLRERRIFIGWPAWRAGCEYRPGKLRESLIDLACPDIEWQQLVSGLEEFHPQYTQNRNLVSKVTKGSIALVPRPARGVTFAGRIAGSFELINDPPWAADYLRLRQEQGLSVEDEGSHVADVAQTWEVDEFRPIPGPLIPAWIRRSLFGRSTYGQIHSLDALDLDPFAILDRLIDHAEQIAREWTNSPREIERRLLNDVGPSSFEHLCVALLQLKHPDEVWTADRPHLCQRPGAESDADLRRGGFVPTRPPRECYKQWKQGRFAVVERASQPTVRVQTATALAAAGGPLNEADLARIQIEKISRTDAQRPCGRRFGALVHAVLAVVNLDASADEITAVAQANAKLMDATAAEIDAAVATVRNALKHPLMQRAAKARALRRETPLQHCREDGTLIEGVVDLAFQEDTSEFNGWTVVDFKTDREIEKAENHYRAQVAAYVEAVRIATVSPTRGFLLVV